MSNEAHPALPAQDVLPFPPTPSGSIAGRTMQESVYSPKPAARRLPADAPNILIILIDDAGPGMPTPLGGEVAAPNLERVMKAGVAYNRFHTTAMCSPTRGALLTGRNHHHIGAGQIAEMANDWDGYAGTIPMSCATVAEVLKNYTGPAARFMARTTSNGWDAYRERVFKRAKACGWIPSNSELTPRPVSLGSWDSIPEAEKPFQRRLMEVCAGFTEHVDHQIGRLLDQVDSLGYGDNTLVFYIWGDNGSSGEGLLGTVSELAAQNGIPSTVAQHIAALDALGGLDVLGSPKTDNQYHAAWAWAGSTPYKGMKLVASHFGGTRNPMAVSWPAKIKPDSAARSQFHHVNDIVPTIYEVVGITPPRVVNGIPQDPIHGISLAYSFNEAAAPGRLRTQYFEIMGSRSIYHDGWMACAFGPREPWAPGPPKGGPNWTPDHDDWELYHLEADWTQAKNLAAAMPEKLAQMKELFSMEAAKNKAYPIGGGLWVPFMHPELRIAPPYTEWNFTGAMQRMPEFTAPALGNRPNLVTIDVDIPENANGVLYSLGGSGGGLTCYFDDGEIVYEYNLFIIQRTKIRSAGKLPAGRTTVEVQTLYQEPRAAGPLAVTIRANGAVVAEGVVPMSAPLLFTANDCLDIGKCLGAPVSLDYYDRAPFPFSGAIHHVNVRYITPPPSAGAAPRTPVAR